MVLRNSSVRFLYVVDFLFIGKELKEFCDTFASLFENVFGAVRGHLPVISRPLAERL
jgi:hypothetical protein